MKKSINKIMRFVAIAVLCLVSVISGQFNLSTFLPLTARAESSIYSEVLDDLKKDSSFDFSYYPVKSEDNSLNVIQLAESSDKELFIYVYQPSGQTKKLNASSINISTTINDFISFKNYKLKLLSDSGTLFKYKVENFIVKTESTRYYVITSIFRPFDESIDKQASGGNVITEVEYAVKRQYCFGEINGKPYVSCVDIETIEVTDKFVGYVRYPDGISILHPRGACDSHFVAFNTDKRIDRLFEADVFYTTQKYTWSVVPLQGEREGFGEKVDDIVYLDRTKEVEHTGGGLFAGTYKWYRIQSIDDFVSEVDGGKREVYSGALFDVSVGTTLTDSAKENLKKQKWVLRFLETDYSISSSAGSTFAHSTFVGDVSILRLKFETDGITYNLGVIDNKQSGSKDPVNDTDEIIEVKPEAKNLGKIILGLIALIVLLLFLMPVLPTIISFVLQVLFLPFKLLGKALNKINFKAKSKGNKTKSGKPKSIDGK